MYLMYFYVYINFVFKILIFTIICRYLSYLPPLSEFKVTMIHCVVIRL